MKWSCIAIWCSLLVALEGTVANAEAANFKTFGISYQPPAQTTSDGQFPADLVSHYLFGANSIYAGAGIEIWCTAANGRSADEWAQAQVKESGKGVEDKGVFTMGGEKAVKVESDLADAHFTHSIAYLAVHGKLAYKIVALNKPGIDADKAAQALMATVSFSPPLKPEKYVDLAQSPWNVFGELTIRLPDTARVDTQSSTELNIVIIDYSGPVAFAPLIFDLRHVKTATKMDFSDLKATYSAGLEKQCVPEGEHLTWHTDDRLPGLNISDAFLSRATPRTHGCRNHVQVCMLELSPGDFVQLIFSIPDLPADEVRTYQSLSKEIVKTVQLVKNDAKTDK
jgi:hypothetical protein